MTREEMLNRLHAIEVKVQLTALPSEGALECIYFTSKGYKEEWIGIDEWTVRQRIDSKGRLVYCVKIDEKRHEFRVYSNFVDFFITQWIGEVNPWDAEEDDDVLFDYLDWVEDLEDGIPIFD